MHPDCPWSCSWASAAQLSHHHGDKGDGEEPSSLEESVEAAAAFVKGHASIRTVMVERIDRLRPIQQLTLKVGSTVSSEHPSHCHACVAPLMHTFMLSSQKEPNADTRWHPQVSFFRTAK